MSLVRSWLLVASIVLILTVAAVARESSSSARRTVVYHIDDSARAIPMIRNITNHRRADKDIRIIVVALAGGIDFLIQDAKDDRGNSYDALVDPLIIDGVEFRVCNNTLKARGIARERLLPDVSVVESGVAEVARLQIEEGAAYIKP